MSPKNRYATIIEDVFFRHYREGMTHFEFDRSDITISADKLGIELPKNLGDLIYSFRYRAPLPERIIKTEHDDLNWIIRPAGKSKYRFVLVREALIAPNTGLVETKIPDATPGLVSKYSLSDEQALLAKVRYNRLIDVFTGVTCYSLQNHLRTTVPNMGQVETDEIYIGVDKKGCQYAIPVQAKGHSDIISVVQIEQDFALCQNKFSQLVSRPIGAQFMGDGIIVLYEFEQTDQGVRVASERHYRLVAPEEVSAEDLENYRNRLAH